MFAYLALLCAFAGGFCGSIVAGCLNYRWSEMARIGRIPKCEICGEPAIGGIVSVEGETVGHARLCGKCMTESLELHAKSDGEGDT